MLTPRVQAFAFYGFVKKKIPPIIRVTTQNYPRIFSEAFPCSRSEESMDLLLPFECGKTKVPVENMEVLVVTRESDSRIKSNTTFFSSNRQV